MRISHFRNSSWFGLLLLVGACGGGNFSGDAGDGAVPDASTVDGAVPDASTVDGGRVDTGSPDAAPDGSLDDGSIADTGPVDSGPRLCASDAECMDLGVAPCEVPVCGTDGLCTPGPGPDGVACDADSNACTMDDRCIAGACVAGAAPDCDDGLTCTDDACTSTGPGTYECTHTGSATGGCFIDGACVAAGASAPDGCSTCDPTSEPAGYTPVIDDTPCNADSNGCSVDDHCVSGACVPGPAAACDDGLSCTADTCTSSGANTYSCEMAVASTSCAIAGACYADTTTNPSNACEICKPAASRTAWSSSTGPCNDGNRCTTGDTCSGGVCGGTPLLDAAEPNNSRIQARPLGALFARISGNRRALAGLTGYPTFDQDWFTFQDIGSSRVLATPGAHVQAGFSQLYEVCVSVNFAGVRSSCGAGSRGGAGRCCATGSSPTAVVIPDSTAPSSLTAYVQVRLVGVASCTDTYTLTYGDFP